MVRHKYISNFIRHRFTAPRVAMWNRLSVIDWFIKWLTGKLNGKIQRPCYRALIIDLDKWHTCMHSLPQSDRILFESLRQTQLILDPFPPRCQWPLTAYSSLLRGLWLLRKARHDSLPHLRFPPSILPSALLHMSASSDTYVAFRVCQKGCFSFHMSGHGWTRPLSLYSLLLLSCALVPPSF